MDGLKSQELILTEYYFMTPIITLINYSQRWGGVRGVEHFNILVHFNPPPI